MADGQHTSSWLVTLVVQPSAETRQQADGGAEVMLTQWC
jgi:hypothetical protein